MPGVIRRHAVPTPFRGAHGPLLFLAALLLGAVGRPGDVRSQEPGGVVTGTVVDSTTMRPLPDAAVFLWNTPYRTATDSAGRFLITGIPPGSYSLVFFHQRLGELGISAGPRTIQMGSVDTTTVALAIPSAHTLEATQCAFEAEVDGVAVGQILDGPSGLPLPGARVRFDWADEGGTIVGRDVRTDASGWFRACDLPRDRVVSVTSDFLDRSTLRREIQLAGGAAFIDLPMARLELTDVEGRLVDAESGEGISDATLHLRGTGFRTTSGASGRFRFRDVQPGHYTLRSEHLAYGVRDDGLDLGSGQTVQLEVQLAQRPIELPPVTVTVEASSATERAMGGTVITPAMVEEVRGHSRDLMDLLQNQNLSGLVIRRQAGNTCIGFNTGQVRITHRGGCVPAVLFIDNVRAADPRMAIDIPAEVVDRIILYRPIEAGNLFGLGSGNGVVMVFTKRR